MSSKGHGRGHARVLKTGQCKMSPAHRTRLEALLQVYSVSRLAALVGTRTERLETMRSGGVLPVATVTRLQNAIERIALGVHEGQTTAPPPAAPADAPVLGICPGCGENALDGKVTCGRAACGSSTGQDRLTSGARFTFEVRGNVDVLAAVSTNPYALEAEVERVLSSIPMLVLRGGMAQARLVASHAHYVGKAAAPSSPGFVARAAGAEVRPPATGWPETFYKDLAASQAKEIEALRRELDARAEVAQRWGKRTPAIAPGAAGRWRALVVYLEAGRTPLLAAPPLLEEVRAHVLALLDVFATPPSSEFDAPAAARLAAVLHWLATGETLTPAPRAAAPEFVGAFDFSPLAELQPPSPIVRDASGITYDLRKSMEVMEAVTLVERAGWTAIVAETTKAPKRCGRVGCNEVARWRKVAEVGISLRSWCLGCALGTVEPEGLPLLKGGARPAAKPPRGLDGAVQGNATLLPLGAEPPGSVAESRQSAERRGKTPLSPPAGGGCRRRESNPPPDDEPVSAEPSATSVPRGRP